MFGHAAARAIAFTYRAYLRDPHGNKIHVVYRRDLAPPIA